MAGKRNRGLEIILVLSVILSIGLGYIVANSGQKTSKLKKILDAERYSRFVAEENVQKGIQKVKSLESELKTAQQKIDRIQSILEQERELNQDLKSQYERISRAKVDLEQKLNTALQPPPVASVPAQQVEPVGQN